MAPTTRNVLVQESFSVLVIDGVCLLATRIRLTRTRLLPGLTLQHLDKLRDRNSAVKGDRETLPVLRCANLQNAWQETFRPMPSPIVPWHTYHSIVMTQDHGPCLPNSSFLQHCDYLGHLRL